MPVYNVSEYLPKCIESVLSQGYENYELVLVNDGSTDRSGDICKEYAKKESRVIYINKENGGVSSARNAGIRAATGEYIIFLDGDDWLCEEILKKSSHIIAETDLKDIYLGDFYWYYPENGKLVLSGFTPKQAILDRANPYEIESCLQWSHSPFGSVRREIFKRDVMLENHVFFDETLSWLEDMDFFLAYTMKCKSFGSLGLPVICYRTKREGSLTSIGSPETSAHVLKALKRWCQYFLDAYSKTGDKSARSLTSYYANELFHAIYISSQRPEYGEAKARALMKENKHLLKYNSGWWVAIKKLLFWRFGFDATQRAITQIKKLKSALGQKLGRG